MQISNDKIREVLISKKYLTSDDIKKAEIASKKAKLSIIDYIKYEHLIPKDLLVEVVAEAMGVCCVNLNLKPPLPELVLAIPEGIARKYKLVVYKQDQKTVNIATDDPLDKERLELVKKIFPLKDIIFCFAFPQDIELCFINYRKALDTRFNKIIAKDVRIAPEIIEEIIEDALSFHASDIHFEPQEKQVLIRFRIDGLLHDAGDINKEYYESMLNRIKVQAHLRTDEHFAAQDGAIRYSKDATQADLRVSILPTVDGEKVVIRVLSEYVRNLTLDNLGLSKSNETLLIAASKKPFGLLMVTGPTGSGKTTTLYGLLKLLNKPEANVSTIEDPVEYKIPGVNHIQVNPNTNLTFADGLRSIVRQDPDVILVGEIRDDETADIAVNAALTGHLVLSTFHANDAATAVPRLLHMGVEPFLLASMLELVIAQRLVRRICNKCKESVPKKYDDIKKNTPNIVDFLDKNNDFFEGKGCEACNFTGYKGRIAIYQFICVSAEIKDLILKNPSTREIWELAKAQGAKSLFDDGIEKVKSGITTIEELMRIAPPY